METFLIYTFVLVAMIVLTRYTPKYIYRSSYKTWRFALWIVAPIILYTLFWGLRDGVGSDYFAYKRAYCFMTAAFRDHMEYGYVWLNNFLHDCGFNYVSIFIVTSAITIISLFAATKHESRAYAIAVVFFFFTTSMVFSAQNGLRQHLAISFITIGISLLPLSRKNIPVIAFMVFASLSVHRSSIIPWCIIGILYFCKELKFNKYFLIGALLVCNFAAITIYEMILPHFENIFSILEYEEYYDSFNNFKMSTELGTGFGLLLKIATYIIVIYNQDSIINNSSSKRTYILYTMFIIGIMAEPIVASHMILKRMILYFVFMKVFVLAYVLTALSKRKDASSKIQYYVLICGYMLLFWAAIASNSNTVVPYKMIEI